jgi:hypothetical protein
MLPKDSGKAAVPFLAEIHNTMMPGNELGGEDYRALMVFLGTTNS